MGKYETLLMFFIGVTLGGVVGYVWIGTSAIISTLFLYLMISFVLLIEIYLEGREDKTEQRKGKNKNGK